MFRLLTLPFRVFFAAFGAFGPLFAFAFAVLPFAAYLIICTVCVKYDVHAILHHTLPTAWALVLSLAIGPVAITAAIVLKVLTLVGALPALLAL